MKKKKRINWKFKAINPVDYEIRITSSMENKLMLYVFSKARTKLARKKGINVRGDINNITRFEIPQNYYNLVRTILKPVIRAAISAIKEDKIETLNMSMASGHFVRDSDNWIVEMIMTGQYVDKR